MNEENIKLLEAMTKPIGKRVRVWIVKGKYVEIEGITQEYTIEKTFVMKAENRDYQVGVEMTEEGDKGVCFRYGDEFSTLDELKEKFPQLFELEGELLSFN